MKTGYTKSGKSRGVTLVECLIFCTLWAILAVATMRVLGDGRVLRGNARDRSTMALIAQSELDRVRALPPQELKAGTTGRTDATWPSDTAATVSLTRRDDGTWLVDVRVARQSVEGKPEVRLTTIRRGGPSS